MAKRVLKCTDPLFTLNYMVCTLAEDDPHRGWKKGQRVSTSSILSEDKDAGTVETRNTIYQIVRDE